MNALEIIRPHVGKQETQGQNRGPFVDLLNNWIGVDLGSSWCATTVCYGFHEADPHTKFPKTAGSQELLRQLRALGCEVTNDAQRMKEWQGALIIRTDHPDTAHGHAGFVQMRYTLKGVITAVRTLEGNSSLTGSSNGDGLYQNRRPVPIPGDWHYIDVGTQFGDAGKFWPSHP